MTIQEFINKQKKRLEEIEKGKVLAEGVANSHATQVTRIFDKGDKSSGDEIGGYNNTKPLYVNPFFGSPKSFPKKGKTGETTFKNGKPHKTGFFKSYQSFRQAIGRKTGFVNLQLFGLLRLDYTNGLRRVSDLKWVAEVKGDDSANKIAGNEKRFGIIFNLTKEEEEKFYKEQEVILARALNK